MEYNKEDWVVGRMYRFVGNEHLDIDPETKFPNPGFVVGEVYEMVTDVCNYWGCPDLLPDARFDLPGDGFYWMEIAAFVPVEQS